MPTLDFKGKQLIYGHHLTVGSRPLEVDVRKSLPPKGNKPSLDGNLIIHGDNLHALKALMPRYAGRVNCIYIDPPYNTGNEKWVYNDNVNGLVKHVVIDAREQPLGLLRRRQRIGHQRLASQFVAAESVNELADCGGGCACGQCSGNWVGCPAG